MCVCGRNWRGRAREVSAGGARWGRAKRLRGARASLGSRAEGDICLSAPHELCPPMAGAAWHCRPCAGTWLFTITGHQGLSFPHGEGLWGQTTVSVLPAQLQAEERGEQGLGHGLRKMCLPQQPWGAGRRARDQMS